MSSSENEEDDVVQHRHSSENQESIPDNEKSAKSTKQKQPNGKHVTRSDGTARRVFIAHQNIAKNDWNNIIAMVLPHPKTQSEALFLFDTRVVTEGSETKHFVYEVLTMTEEDGLSSWFLGNFVSSDGNLYCFTPIDPLYIVLSAMVKSNYAKPLLDHLIEFFPMKFAKVLNRRTDQKQLLNISNRKISGDIEAFVFDENKALAWLKKKVTLVANYFSGANLTRSEASMSATFIRAASNDTTSNEHIWYACDLVCEYVEDSLKRKLENALGMPAEAERPKRKNSDHEEGSKRLKLENGEVVAPLEDYGSAGGEGKSTTKGAGTARQKQLQQAAKGTHSLLKFFSPKPKAK